MNKHPYVAPKIKEPVNVKEIYKSPIHKQYVIIAANQIKELLGYKNPSEKSKNDETTDGFKERTMGVYIVHYFINTIEKEISEKNREEYWIREVGRIAYKSINGYTANDCKNLEEKMIESFNLTKEVFSKIENFKEKKEVKNEEDRKSLLKVSEFFYKMYDVLNSKNLSKFYKIWEKCFNFGKQNGWAPYSLAKDYRPLERKVLEELKQNELTQISKLNQ